jgi:SAM-dependent methyltransferase
MIASAVEAAFDTLAEQYDALWSYSAIGREQRAAVWRWIDPLFHAGDRVLDLGCGTGVDADHFRQRRVEVYGIDASREMVRLARARGVDAHHLAIETLGDMKNPFDGAVSNFGALNCVSNLESVALALGRLIHSGGYVAICLAGPCSLWETAHYLVRRKIAKAFRRWNPSRCEAPLGVRLEYPTVRHLMRLFLRDFRLIHWCGIGLCVPPSYVRGISEATIARLAAADRRLAHRRVFRALADHRLFVFQRI